MSLVALFGASGHGKVVAEVAEEMGMQVHFYDDAWPKKTQLGRRWAVHGDSERFRTNAEDYAGAIVSIGNSKVRLEIQTRLRNAGVRLVTLVHPRACISRYASISAGSVVMAGAIVNADAEIGIACIVNTGATVDHDCVIGDGVHIAPGANLSGGVLVSSGTWVGVGACVKQGVRIGANVMIGAGAVVLKDVPDCTTVIGNPARRVESSR